LVQNNPKLKETKWNKMRWSPVIVSNHVSWFDIMIHTNLNSGSFLSKTDIINYPLWGVSAMALQSIFVERENKNERSSSI
jgi:1-acyl-sn-glycerol-3-phosphate acyltransferase